jgi:hypothetical protein
MEIDNFENPGIDCRQPKGGRCTKYEGRPPEDGHRIRTETCRGFLMTLLKNVFDKF